MKREPPPNKTPEAIVMAILRLYELGHPYDDIADILGVCTDTVKNYIKAAGVPRRGKNWYSKFRLVLQPDGTNRLVPRK